MKVSSRGQITIPKPLPKFIPLAEHQPGILYDLLLKSYRELLASDPDFWRGEQETWHRFDRDAFGKLNTIGNCIFITGVEATPVGFGSFDLRLAPARGIIGHNCVVPEARGRGIGSQQIKEILRRFKEAGLRMALVSTSEHPFFLPAQRMYLACGFKEIRRLPGGPDPRYRLIEYQQEV